MNGIGILKSFGVTLRRFLLTYLDDIKYLGRRYRPETLPARQSPKGRGIFVVQYPKEKLPLPERYRNFPFQVLDSAGKPRCTACGICAKVCPPQCIWIVRAKDPETGKPKREPVDFYIDVSICMSCGLCAEFCPFDAIKMDHDYEVASYERAFLWDLEKLAKPLAHHAEIHPSAYADEKAARDKTK